MKSEVEVELIKTQLKNEINKLLREGDSDITAWIKEQILRGKLEIIEEILENEK